MYEDSETLYLEIMFQAKNFSQLITLSNYVDALASYDKKKFDEYQQYRIDPKNTELIQLLTTDPKLRQMTIRAEGYLLLVENDNLKKFTDELKKHGYLL